MLTQNDSMNPKYRVGLMRPIRDVATLAHEELLTPYPSFKINLWPNFSKATGGFRTREFSILCGATGVGKTCFLANLSMQLLMQGVKHFVASVETGDTDFVKRIESAFLEEDINTGDAVSIEKIVELKQRWGGILGGENLMLSLFSNRVSLELLLSELKIAHERYGCKIAMLDNMNFFMDVTAAKDSLVEMDRTIHELIMFCKYVDMHVIMVMHPRKTESGRVENEYDIKGSATAVQEAHNVFLFNRPTEFDQGNGYDAGNFRELKIAKMRRRGGYVGKRIMLKNFNTCYTEHDIL